MLSQIWGYKVQIFPVLLFLGIYEVPALLRRIKKIFYVPIYFSIYPFRQINQDLSTYLAEDYFLCQGFDLNLEQAELLRKRIIGISIVSALIDAVVVPLVMGFVFAFILDISLFFQCLIVLVLYKVISIVLSIKESHFHFIDSKWKTVALTLIYIAYVGMISENLKDSYFWAKPFIVASNWLAMWSSFSNLFFGEILTKGVLFVIAVSVFTNFIADRRLREINILK